MKIQRHEVYRVCPICGKKVETRDRIHEKTELIITYFLTHFKEDWTICPNSRKEVYPE